MVCATRGGDGALWYSLLVVVLLFGGDERFAAAGSASLAVSLGIGLFLGLKRLTNRRRPCEIQTHCWSTLLPPDQFSFPSGHTITAFAFCIPMVLHYPQLTPGLLFCAFSIGLSRILLGMHFLSDVVAGAILGSTLGWFCFRLLS
jgi:undecaprenyl-diphosphatase